MCLCVTIKDEFWKVVWDPVITSFFLFWQTLHPQRSNSRLIALSPFRNHFCVWAIVSKQWHLIPNIIAKRGRERVTDRDEMSPYFLFFAVNIYREIWWNMNPVSPHVFKLNIIHRLNHVTIMSTVMVWLLNNTAPRWVEAPVSVLLDTTLTGTQSLASTQPATTGRARYLPSVIPEPAGRAEQSDSTSKY